MLYTREPTAPNTQTTLSRRTVLILTGSTVAAGSAAWAGSALWPATAPKPASRCVAVVADLTDPLPPSARPVLRSDVAAILARLRAGDELDIAVVPPASEPRALGTVSFDRRADALAQSMSEPLRFLFRGKRPQTAAETSTLIDNPRFRGRDDDAWMRKVTDCISGIEASAGSAQASPILEALWVLAQDQGFRTAEQREVWLYSDLVQSSKIANFFDQRARKPSFDAVLASRSHVLTGLNAFAGATITVRHLKTLNASHQTDAVLAFWRAYLANAGFQHPDTAITAIV